MPETVEVFPGGSMWALLCSVAQVVAAPTPIGIKITPGEGNMLKIQSIRVIAGTFGAGRTVTVKHKDSAGNTVMELGTKSMTTNEAINVPGLSVHTTATGNTASKIGAPTLPYFVCGTDYIAIEIASAANGEVTTFNLRCLVRAFCPVVAAIGAGISVTTTYDKVI